MMRKGKAPANGTELYFECTGAASGLPLVLIPETGVDRRIWGDQVRAFAERYQVIRYDLRGWGRSPRRMGVYRDAEDLAGLLDWLGIERAALVGFSHGAEIALDLALVRPELVAALVLVEPSVSGLLLARRRPAEFDAALERLAVAAARPNRAMRLVRMVAVFRAISRHAYAPGGAPRQTWRSRWANWLLWANLLENLPRTLAMTFGGPSRHLHAVDRQDLNPQAPSYTPRKRTPPVHACLGQVVAPTLLVRGTPTPPLALELHEELLMGIAGAELEEVVDGQRLPQMIRPDTFNRIVLDFLQRVYPSS